MDARMKKKNRSLVFGLRRQQLLRLVLTLVLYTAAAPLLYILAQLLYSLFIWQEYDLIYRLAHWFADRTAILALGYIGLGYTAIFLHYFSQSFSYLEEVLEGAESIYEDDGEPLSVYTNAGDMTKEQLESLGRYCSFRGDSVLIDTNLREIPQNMTAEMEKNNLYDADGY